MKSEDFILFILAVIILTTKTANAVDVLKNSFVEQIDTLSEESSVNDEISATDQISTSGFGFVTTVLNLFL